MPPREEYEQNKYFKQCGKIPGDLHLQGKVGTLGLRTVDVESDIAVAVDVPEVRSTCMSVQWVF